MDEGMAFGSGNATFESDSPKSLALLWCPETAAAVSFFGGN
jgi:hypothetical protein